MSVMSDFSSYQEVQLQHRKDTRLGKIQKSLAACGTKITIYNLTTKENTSTDPAKWPISSLHKVLNDFLHYSSFIYCLKRQTILYPHNANDKIVFTFTFSRLLKAWHNLFCATSVTSFLRQKERPCAELLDYKVTQQNKVVIRKFNNKRFYVALNWEIYSNLSIYILH